MKKSVDFIANVCYNSTISSEFSRFGRKNDKNKNKILY